MMEGLSHYSPEEKKNNEIKTEKKKRSLNDKYIIFTSCSGNFPLCIFFFL